MNTILSAILDNNHARVTKLLEADSSLAVRRVEVAKLYQSKIFHWLYAGDTALHLAAAGYRERIAGTLLAAGADPNAAGNHRRSRPLHYAADGYTAGPAWDPKAQVKTIRILLNAGADIHAGDKNGATALHRAVRTRCADAVRFLLNGGADPTRKNLSGSTAFHLAVQNTGRGGSGAKIAIAAQRQIIEQFLSFGASRCSKMAKANQSRTARRVLGFETCCPNSPDKIIGITGANEGGPRPLAIDTCAMVPMSATLCVVVRPFLPEAKAHVDMEDEASMSPFNDFSAENSVLQPVGADA